MSGLKSIALAAGLMLAGLGHAAAPAPSGAPAAAAAPAAPAPAVAVTRPAAPDTLSPEAAPANPATPAAGTIDGAPAMLPVPGVGMPTPGAIGIQPQVTKNGRFGQWMHDIVLFPLITAISLLVLGLLVWVILRYRRAANPMPSRTTHNTLIEVLWTLVPVVILVIIAIPSIGLLQAQFKPAPAGAVTLKAIGNQWYWTYQFPDHGGFEVTANMLKERDQVAPGERARTDADGPRLLAVDNRIVLPVGVPIRLITTSNDVIHAWAMPAFWMKLDAVPGRLNETSFTIEKPGLYFGQCSELCGARHAYMPIAVEAVSPAQFAAWVASKGGTMPGAAAPSAAAPVQAGAPGAAAPEAPAEFAPASDAATVNGTDTRTAPISDRTTGSGTQGQ